MSLSEIKLTGEDGVAREYVLKDSIQAPAPELDGMKYCIIRSYGAGVFAGFVKEQKAEANGVNVTMISARRIWYWSGACSLSQIAAEGSKDIGACKISVVVPEHFVANAIEIIPASNQAKIQISGAKEWKK